jgi:DNA-directed RNA polymerase subunit alpha
MNSNLFTRSISVLKPAEHYMIDTNDNKAKFRIEPLQKGFGTTIGNSLRRIMLSYISGAAVVGVRIEGVEHEYSTISGIKEDVLDIILNLKSLVLITDSDDRKTISLNVSGKTTVVAAMIDTCPGVEIVNKDLVICHITDPNTTLSMDIYISSGSGYVTSEQNKKLLPHSPHYSGVIGVDSIFSPIKRVAYNVETYYSSTHDKEQERLFLTVETNGAIQPDMAVAISAKILQNQVQPFIGMNIEALEDKEIESRISFDPRLLMRVENLDLSVRSQNCLKNENIIYVGDLVTKSELDMLRTPNFGRKSLTEMKEVLARMNLSFDMEIPGWPPEGNIEELSRRYEETIQS